LYISGFSFEEYREAGVGGKSRIEEKEMQGPKKTHKLKELEHFMFKISQPLDDLYKSAFLIHPKPSSLTVDTRKSTQLDDLQDMEIQSNASDTNEINREERRPSFSKKDQDEEQKINKFLSVLSSPIVNIDTLKSLCWNGIPSQLRAQCWQLLLGYLPCHTDQTELLLRRKRDEYEGLRLYYYKSKNDDDNLLQQVLVDVPRTIPKGFPMSVLHDKKTQKLLERVLYIWSRQNEHIGYFQGLGDILNQFVCIFLCSYIDVENFQSEQLTSQTMDEVEADSYWCLTTLLGGSEHHYSLNLDEGMGVMMEKMKQLIGFVDAPLSQHLNQQTVDMLHFSFPWMLCLLTRELPWGSTSRLWDSYLSEGSSFSVLHVYVCTALVIHWSDQLKKKDFAEILQFLHHIPTDNWTTKEVDDLLHQAFLIGMAEKTFTNFLILLAALIVIVLFVLYLLFVWMALYSLNHQKLPL